MATNQGMPRNAGQPLETRTGKEWILPPGALKGACPCQQLASGLLASRTMREEIPALLCYQGCVICHGIAKKLIQSSASFPLHLPLHLILSCQKQRACRRWFSGKRRFLEAVFSLIPDNLRHIFCTLFYLNG